MSQNKPQHAPHCVDRLRAKMAATSTRPFNARGVSVKRCAQCLLGEQNCICSWRRPHLSATINSADWLLLLHRDEVFKPTNTGRLVADQFPAQSHAFCWDRTQPAPELLALLQDPRRRCFIIFPSDATAPRDSIKPTVSAPYQTPQDGRQLTLILLDGTWKQARKMYNRSDWLKDIPLLDLEHILASEALAGIGNYRVRQAVGEGQLATAEAAAAALLACNQAADCHQLLDYFDVFNEHYVAMRMNRQPTPIDAHQRILSSGTDHC